MHAFVYLGFGMIQMSSTAMTTKLNCQDVIMSKITDRQTDTHVTRSLNI